MLAFVGNGSGTMTNLEQFQLVRVRQLLHPATEYHGWRVNTRDPAIGDVGTLVDILRADGLPNKFVVECCHGDGQAVWLADFDADELEEHVGDPPQQQTRAHLVFLRSNRLLLVKRPVADWRQLQDDYSDYMTSLGPWTAYEIASYFMLDYTDDDSRWPFTRREIKEFFSRTETFEISTK